MTKLAMMILAMGIVGLLPISALQTADAEKSAHLEPAQAERPLFVIILKPGPKWKRGKHFSQQGLGPHFRYLKSLVEKGDLMLAGPMGNDHGLILVRAKTQEAADHILDNDPAVLQGTFVGEAKPYSVTLLGTTPLALSRT